MSQTLPVPLSSLLDLSGRTALVTGAAQGFGFAIAVRLAEAGAHVLMADRDAGAGHAACERVRALGFRADAVELDITDEARVVEVIDGAGGLDILVNNAGVFSNALATNLDSAEFHRIMSVNVHGTFLCSRQFARTLHDDGRSGVIVNVASVDALQPSCAGQIHYTASKHAVAGLTKALSVELAPSGTRVVAVCPGASLTEGAMALVAAGTDEGIDIEQQWSAISGRTPLGRLITPDEVACAVVFLASPMAGAITGVLLAVDGGITAQPLEGYDGFDERPGAGSQR